MNDGTDVDWQFDVASYYRTVMQSQILTDDSDAARHVEREIQEFAKLKLGEIMGFTRSATPAPRRPVPPPQKPTRTVAPVQRTVAPVQRPQATQQPSRSTRPESAPLIKRPEVKKAPNEIPTDGEVRQEGNRTYRFRWTPADPDSFPPNIATKALTMDVSSKEGLKLGEQYIVHPAEGEWFIVRKKNISRQVGSKDAAPWRQDLVEAAMMSKASVAGRAPGTLLDADQRSGADRYTMSGDVSWSV